MKRLLLIALLLVGCAAERTESPAQETRQCQDIRVEVEFLRERVKDCAEKPPTPQQRRMRGASSELDLCKDALLREVETANLWRATARIYKAERGTEL